eukprot:1692794-Prymnesium_polylepis.2
MGYMVARLPWAMSTLACTPRPCRREGATSTQLQASPNREPDFHRAPHLACSARQRLSRSLMRWSFALSRAQQPADGAAVAARARPSHRGMMISLFPRFLLANLRATWRATCSC